MSRIAKDFESFLVEKHAEGYSGLDDSMPDACSDWIADLSLYELIAYADIYATTKAMEAVQDIGNKIIGGMK